MSLNLELSYLESRVERLEAQNTFLRNKVKELEDRTGSIDLSQKQKEQLRGYHEGHEEQQGYDHYSEPDYEDNMPDNEADAQTLASAGWGTDEDYGLHSDDGSDRL